MTTGLLAEPQADPQLDCRLPAAPEGTTGGGCSRPRAVCDGLAGRTEDISACLLLLTFFFINRLLGGSFKVTEQLSEKFRELCVPLPLPASIPCY